MKKVTIIGMIVLIINVFVCTYFFMDYKINKNLKIDLNGDASITLNVGEEYQELGAKASYKDKDISGDVKFESNLDNKKVGKYTITYEIKYKNKTKKVVRNIDVVDKEKPAFEVNNNKLVILTGSSLDQLDIKASDNYDGDLSKKVEKNLDGFDINKPGEYQISYKVKDTSGNEEIINKDVIVTNNFATSIPVLNYHFFYENGQSCNELICENMDTFRKQLDYLRDNNYYTLTIDEFTKWMYGEIELPEKSILITVDDGAFGTSKINGNNLIPALEQYKMHATLFLITGWWDIENYRSPYLDIQSHTHDLHYEASCGHRSKVNCVSYDALLEDLRKSIDVVKDTNSFCFPFYDYTESSINAVKEAGFKIAFVGGRRKATRDDDKYKVPRYPIYDTTSMDSFINMIS